MEQEGFVFIENGGFDEDSRKERETRIVTFPSPRRKKLALPHTKFLVAPNAFQRSNDLPASRTRRAISENYSRPGPGLTASLPQRGIKKAADKRYTRRVYTCPAYCTGTRNNHYTLLTRIPFPRVFPREKRPGPRVGGRGGLPLPISRFPDFPTDPCRSLPFCVAWTRHRALFYDHRDPPAEISDFRSRPIAPGPRGPSICHRQAIGSFYPGCPRQEVTARANGTK